MTVITVVTAGEVSRIFAGRRHAVVARAAGTQYLGVVNCICGRPHIRVVAIFADVACLNVRRAFARGFSTVVAAEAIPCDVDVIEVSRQPADRRVAVVAVSAARDVRCVLAGRRDAVMAGTASANDLCVVDGRRRLKQRCAVAVFADVAGLNVSQAFASGGRAVMTANAVVGDA